MRPGPTRRPVVLVVSLQSKDRRYYLALAKPASERSGGQNLKQGHPGPPRAPP